MTAPAYRLRLMFEWGGGTLWADAEATRDRFGVGPLDDRVPVSDALRARLDDLSRRHDTALDWADPAGPSRWTPEEERRFDEAAREVLDVLRAELGPDFELRYEALRPAPVRP